MVKTGAAVGVGAWVAPSILTYDKAYAAVGSCGTKPLQLDWTPWRGTNPPFAPSAMTANDGVEVTLSVSDPFGVQSNAWDARVYNNTINGRTHPLITGMNNANLGEGVTLTFTFSTPVQPSFFLVDVDRGTNSWEDSVEILGSLGGGSSIDPDSLAPGGTAVTVVTPRLVRGVFSSSSSNSEVEVDFQDPIDTMTIRHFDEQNRNGFQWIGIHDLHWC